MGYILTLGVHINSAAGTSPPANRRTRVTVEEGHDLRGTRVRRIFVLRRQWHTTKFISYYNIIKL